MDKFGKRDMQEDEEFWTSSKVKSNKVNLFDDAITVETADTLAKSKRFLNDGNEENEETDTIEWDGTPSSATPVVVSINLFLLNILQYMYRTNLAEIKKKVLQNDLFHSSEI